MRIFAALAIALAASVISAGLAGAENRTFIILNNADGYGVDRCLANGERCGAAVATAYCQSHDFARANSFQRVERDEITGAVPTSGRNACVGNCDSFVAIICSR